jgi:hypothetical protein
MIKTTWKRGEPSGQTAQLANTINQLTEIYRLTVSRGHVAKIDPTRPFICYLPTQEQLTAAGVHGAAEVFPATLAVARVLDAAGGYTDGAYQDYALMSSGARDHPITAVNDHVDAGADTITGTSHGAAAHMVSYVPFEAGELVIRVESPRGLGAQAYPIFQKNTKELHAMNQWRFNALDCPFPIPPDYMLAFYLKAAWIHCWNTNTTLLPVDLPFAELLIPVDLYEEQEFYVKGEKYPLQTLKDSVDQTMLRLAR